MPVVDTETPTYTPRGFTLSPQVHGMMPHWHSPETGGEIVWSDIDLAKRYNECIYVLKQNHPFPDQLHFLKTPVLPSRGFNQHHHTSFADGGAIYGAGVHSHMGNLDCGYAFCVYHPGTSVPFLPFDVEGPSG